VGGGGYIMAYVYSDMKRDLDLIMSMPHYETMLVRLCSSLIGEKERTKDKKDINDGMTMLIDYLSQYDDPEKQEFISVTIGKLKTAITE